MGMQAGSDKDAALVGSVPLQASANQDQMMLAKHCANPDRDPGAAERATASRGISILNIRSSG